MKQKPGESSEDYVNRLCAEADKCVSNLNNVKKDMKKKGIVGFCKECGCDIYKDKKHICI